MQNPMSSFDFVVVVLHQKGRIQKIQQASSMALGIGFSSPSYVDGNGVQQSGIPVYEYVYPLGSALGPSGPLDAGAY
jgi:hypothetical protein